MFHRSPFLETLLLFEYHIPLWHLCPIHLINVKYQFRDMLPLPLGMA
jgi:hypothetical protein